MHNNHPLSELERKFPRIVEQVILLWNKLELGHYLNTLMIDDRGDRHGFPEEAASEILFLRALHDYHMQPNGVADSRFTWTDPLYTKPLSHDGAD